MKKTITNMNVTVVVKDVLINRNCNVQNKPIKLTDKDNIDQSRNKAMVPPMSLSKFDALYLIVASLYSKLPVIVIFKSELQGGTRELLERIS